MQLSFLPSNAFIDPNGQNIKEISFLVDQIIKIAIEHASSAGNHRTLPSPESSHYGDIPETGIDLEELLKKVKAVVKNSMNPLNPKYMGHMDSIPELGDIHKEVFLNPAIFSLIDMVKNQRVLDAGCGEGYFSRLLAKAGASVTAVDYSPRMIDIAKERTPDDLPIEYRHGNCEDLNMLEDKNFDLIISNMVIQDLADYEEAFQEMHRLLTDRGFLFFRFCIPASLRRKAAGRKQKTEKNCIGM
nr:class I SAM-dependent methyltransferase [Bacillus haynesii]